jgi:peptidoglycan/xylan/chitin deacetylase (PgdA/CDA1 family)
MYHRVIPPDLKDFVGYEPTISAWASSFEQQMAFVRRHFNAISLDMLIDWQRGRSALPSRPLLITFDDGYRDTYDFAWPVLKRYELPSVLFVVTDYIGAARLFDWDIASYCFHRTSEHEADLPLIGFREWRNDAQRRALMHEWIRALLKQPGDVRQAAVEELSRTLDVELSGDVSRGLCLNWEQVRQMEISGMAIGSHSQTHPILTRISAKQAGEELANSRERISDECGRPASAFAYPNGVFDAGLQELISARGYQLAFGTQPGPSPLATVRKQPWAVRRIGISWKDGPCRFLAKLVGLVRLKRWITARLQQLYPGGASGSPT